MIICEWILSFITSSRESVKESINLGDLWMDFVGFMDVFNIYISLYMYGSKYSIEI